MKDMTSTRLTKALSAAFAFMAFAAILCDLARRHENAAAGTGELVAPGLHGLGLEGDAAGGAEARVLGVPSIALGTDQAQVAVVANDGRGAELAPLGPRVDQRSAGAAAVDRRVPRCRRLVLDGDAAAARKAFLDDVGDVVLGVAVAAGDETHGVKRIGSPGGALYSTSPWRLQAALGSRKQACK